MHLSVVNVRGLLQRSRPKISVQSYLINTLKKGFFRLFSLLSLESPISFFNIHFYPRNVAGYVPTEFGS